MEKNKSDIYNGLPPKGRKVGRPPLPEDQKKPKNFTCDVCGITVTNRPNHLKSNKHKLNILEAKMIEEKLTVNLN